MASLSVINRHIAPITIPEDEIYKYVASNLDFSEAYKDKTAKLDTAVEDVETKKKGYSNSTGMIDMSSI